MDAANIVDVVSEYVTLRRAGANYKGLCPFHDDKTPSFHVSPAKGICKCFACGEGGNAVHFIMKMEQLSYFEALRWLGKKYGIEVEDREITPEQRQQLNERESMFNVNEWASQYYHRLLKDNTDGRAIGLAYFRNRGFRDDIIEKFRLGFSLDQWEALSKEARSKGYKDDYLVRTGLCFRRDDGRLTDRYRGRVMFPWFNVSGKVVAFGGRVLDARTKGVSQKYINSPESDIYNKGRELYGIFQAKKAIAKEDRVYMVEGYTDVLSMHQCGVENVVANSGTALTEPQIRLLHRYTDNITLLYDGDDAGIHAALRGTDMLLAEGMNVKILLLPDGDDPDSFAQKHNATEFKSYVEENQTDFILFKTNLLLKDAGRDPLKRAQLTQSIVYSISVIPDEILRSAYVHECAEILRQDEAMLLREIGKSRQAALEQMRKQQAIERERQQRLDNQARQAAEREQSTESEHTTARDTAGSSPSPAEATSLPARATSLPSESASLPAGTTSHPSETTSSSYLSPEEQEHLDYLESLAQTEGTYHAVPAATDPSPSASHPSVPTPESSSYDSRFRGIERMMMTLIVRYGEQQITAEGEDGAPLQTPLVSYVCDDLAADALTLHTPLYARMLAEAARHISDADFVASRFFMNSPDLEISQEAVSLMTERYQLSKFQSKDMEPERTLMPEYITHLLLDYKFLVIDNEMKQCQDQMTDPAQCTQAMQRYMQLSDIQRQLAKRLGDRILIK